MSRRNDDRKSRSCDCGCREDSGSVMQWLGQQNGSFAASFATYQMPLDWQNAASGDFNGDGRTDIAWRNDSGTVMDWLGQAHRLARATRAGHAYLTR